jgi:IMP dehydrogenase
MQLVFDRREILSRGRGLTFDDVLLVPQRSDVRSRRDPRLTSKLTKNLSIELPIISANMDTVTESDMAIAMAKEGAFGILHRFMSVEAQIDQVKKVKASST